MLDPKSASAGEKIVTIPFDQPRIDGFPDWFVERKNLAWDKALALPFPARTDQGWRFSSLRATKLDGAVLTQPEFDTDEVLSKSQACKTTSGKMVFVNDTCIHQSGAAEGLQLLTLEEALESHGDLLKEHFMNRQPELGSQKYLAMHEALVQTAAVCLVPKNLELNGPIEIFRWQAGEKVASFPHTLIIAEPNSKVTVVEHFCSLANEQGGHVFGVNDVVAMEGSKICYIGVQDWSFRTTAFHINSSELHRDSSVTHLVMNLGGSAIRGESISRLMGPGSRSDMLALNVAEAEQEYDQRTLQDHVSPDTNSDLLYKNVLADKARTIFSGLIMVQPGAHRTDAYQKARNLLLSDEAEANSMPGLEILADDVRCSHGATSGELDATELFYMLSRGISEAEARRLIAFGFLNEALLRLPNHETELVEMLTARLEAHLARRPASLD